MAEDKVVGGYVNTKDEVILIFESGKTKNTPGYAKDINSLVMRDKK